MVALDTDTDLGGAPSRVVSIPGHTDESAMIVDRKQTNVHGGLYI